MGSEAKKWLTSRYQLLVQKPVPLRPTEISHPKVGFFIRHDGVVVNQMISIGAQNSLLMAP